MSKKVFILRTLMTDPEFSEVVCLTECESAFLRTKREREKAR